MGCWEQAYLAEVATFKVHRHVIARQVHCCTFNLELGVVIKYKIEVDILLTAL